MTKKELYERDYRDICYFVDHVKNINLRVDILKKMGYRLGVDVASKEGYEKRVVIGKRKEKRIQISPKEKGSPFVFSIIVN